MSASNTDKLRKGSSGTRPVVTSLSLPMAASDLTATISDPTGWDTTTGVDVTIFRKQLNAQGTAYEVVPGSQTDWVATLVGSVLSNMVLRAGTMPTSGYPADSLTVVKSGPNAAFADDLYTWGIKNHDEQGNHNNLTDSSGLTWLERNPQASAVNNARVANSATGQAVVIDANGTDPNIDIALRGKGTGVAHAKNPELFFDFIPAGTGVIAISSGLIGTFSDIAYYIGGQRYKKTGIANKTYTINKDTYVDIDTSGNITYTEVANNAASPALAANNIRVAIVVTNGTAIASINQGLETAQLPVQASVQFYSVTDSLGNIICPRDPNRKVLGYREVRSSINASGTAVTFVTGLSLPVIIPAGRKIKITVFAPDVANNPSAGYVTLSVWDGTVGAGTQIQSAQTYISTGGASANQHLQVYLTPGATSKTYNVGVQTTVATGRIDASATSPGYILVELA